MRLFQRAHLARLCPVGLLHPEQFDFHAVGRYRRGVDDDKRAVRPRRLAVQRARGKLLARPGRTDDQDAAVGRRDLVDGLPQRIDRRRATDDARRQRAECLELLDLAAQARRLQRAVGDQNEPVRLERLLDEVVGALLDGGHCGFDVAVPRDHHHRQIGMLFLDHAEKLQAVKLAALQPDVEEDQIGTPARDRVQRGVAVARGAGVVALVLQQAGHQLADVRLVVNDENVRRHASARSCSTQFVAG